MPFSPITAEDASHLSPLLGLCPNVAARFDAETRTDRVAHLRRGILIGLLFYNVYNITNVVLMPDAIALGLCLRLCVVTPFALGLVWWVGRVEARWRELGVLLGSVGSIVVPIFMLWYTQSPRGVYAAAEAMLTMVYTTMMLVPRFPHALAFVAISAMLAIPSYYLKPGTDMVLAATLSLQFVTACTFVLYGNYRLERSVRRSYLVALQASLQSASLRIDNHALERLSLVDSLTGIANRRRFSERLQAWTDELGARGRAMGLIMIDVDHFKAYNDHYGHPAGDACLQRIAAAMSCCLRDDRDLLTRYGGEEFAALLPDADVPTLRAVAQRLCKAVEVLGLAHDRRGDGCHVVTISAGVAREAASGPERAEHLVSTADRALYQAKHSGRNRYVVNASSFGRSTDDRVVDPDRTLSSDR